MPGGCGLVCWGWGCLGVDRVISGGRMTERKNGRSLSTRLRERSRFFPFGYAQGQNDNQKGNSESNGKGNSKGNSKRRSRFPSGMTERTPKTTARTTTIATAGTAGLSTARSQKRERFGRDDNFIPTSKHPGDDNFIPAWKHTGTETALDGQRKLDAKLRGCSGWEAASLRAAVGEDAASVFLYQLAGYP